MDEVTKLWKFDGVPRVKCQFDVFNKRGIDSGHEIFKVLENAVVSKVGEAR